LEKAERRAREQQQRCQCKAHIFFLSGFRALSSRALFVARQPVEKASERARGHVLTVAGRFRAECFA